MARAKGKDARVLSNSSGRPSNLPKLVLPFQNHRSTISVLFSATPHPPRHRILDHFVPSTLLLAVGRTSPRDFSRSPPRLAPRPSHLAPPPSIHSLTRRSLFRSFATQTIFLAPRSHHNNLAFLFLRSLSLGAPQTSHPSVGKHREPM